MLHEPWPGPGSELLRARRLERSAVVRLFDILLKKIQQINSLISLMHKTASETSFFGARGGSEGEWP